MSWPMTCLGDVATLERRSLLPEEIESGTSYLGLEHIESGGRILGYQRVEAGELQSNKFTFDPGTLLYGKLRPYLAKICIPDRKGCCSTDILPIRPGKKLDISYLKHLLLWRPYVDKANSLCAGANLPRISPSSLLGIEIPLPPLEEQRRIAAILDKGHAIQTLIDRREKVFLAVEESLFAALGEEGTAAKSSRVFDFAEVFWLQEGPGVRNWQFTAEGVKLLNVGNITPDGRLDLQKTNRHISEVEAFGRYSHFLVDEGDLLMPSSGIPIDEDGFLRTRSAFASVAHLPLCMNTSTIRFKPKMEGSSLLFLQGWLQSREFRAQITKLVTGSAQKNFGPSHLKQLQITLPEPGAQSEFEEKLNKIRGLRASLSPSVDEAERLIGAIAHRVFAGGEHE